MPARAENEDVYATADAAWMTEAGDADEADTAAAAAGDAADDDTGTLMRTTPPLMTR